jgi:integrase
VLRRFKAATKRAGLGERRFHDLRHTFGTRMAATPGVSLRSLQEWLGHRDLATTLIYADYAPAEREAELVERAFAAVGTKPGTKLGENGKDTEGPSPHEHEGAALGGA